MKIALLLRGQLRYAQAGSQLFERYIRQRFPQHEFRIFWATYASVSGTMSKNTGQAREFYTEILPNAQQLLDHWDTCDSVVIPERELLSVAERVRAAIVDRALNTNMHSLYPQESNIVGRSWVAPDVDRRKEETIRIHYVLGQIYSQGRSAELLKYHVDVTDWVPDLVWSTRPDHINWFRAEPDAFRLIHQSLLQKHRIDPRQHHTAVDTVEIRNGRPFVSDFNFFQTYDTMKNTFLDAQDRIINTFENEFYNVALLPGSVHSLQHVLWTAIYDTTCWISHNYNHLLQPGTLLRPVEKIDQLLDTALTQPQAPEHIQNLRTAVIESYVYPNARRDPPSPHRVDTQYKLLKNN